MSKRGFGSGGGSNVVKNRAPAPIQISAEQIVREAADRQELFPAEPIIQIHDAEEYQSFLRDRRKLFEDNIRYRREHIGNWVKYAKFEEENKEYERARSIFERALEVDHRSGELWLRYVEFEIRNEFINHARNILDRAIQILPRIDFLWYKYVYMEEMIGDIPKCRAVFERWMEWCPDDNAWTSYARFETRCGQSLLAENVMRRYVNVYPTVNAFIRFAKWAEFDCKNVTLARTIYESALIELEPEESKQARLFKQFASFEERHGEYDRARVIYNHAMKLFQLGQQQTQADDGEEVITAQEKYKRNELYQSYISFEKKHGDKDHIENVIIQKQRIQYKERLQADPYDYDGWFELAKLEEENQMSVMGSNKTASKSSSSSDYEIQMARNLVRDTYERAIANVPPDATHKDSWRRYIYLWIYYATYEELMNRELDRAIEIYTTCLNDVIPHKQFSFAKIWILCSKLYIRKLDIISARKLLGKAIGLCGKEKIYIEYINIELSLGEIDRCRTLYTNYLKAMPYNCSAWCKFAELEKSVGETDRCRAIYELAISDQMTTSQQPLDMPELIWKSYIDFELEEGEIERVRQLYQRLLQRTGGNVKVWISYAQFEGSTTGKDSTDDSTQRAREIFQTASDELKNKKQHEQDDDATATTTANDNHNLNEDRVLLLDAWRTFEKTNGTMETIASVEAKMPRRIKRKRMKYSTDGTTELGWEEYFDYHFPDDSTESNNNNANSFKILEMAAKWKEQQRLQQQDEDSDDTSDEDE